LTESERDDVLVTKLLGELEEEVATANTVDVREKFSVAEIESISPSMQIKLKDRVVPR
jgi:hypothetical protein